MTVHNPHTPSSEEVIADGITREWLDGGQIVKYGITTVDRNALAQWSAVTIATLESWDVSRPYLALYDLYDRKIGVTPYFQEESSKIATVAPEARGRIAVVIPVGAIGFVLRMTINRLKSNKNAVREFRAFQDVDQALDWLREIQD